MPENLITINAGICRRASPLHSVCDARVPLLQALKTRWVHLRERTWVSSSERQGRNLDPAEEGSLPAPRQVAMGDRAACKVRRILKSARDIAAPDPIARESTKVGVKGHFQGYDCQLFAKYAAAVRFIGERGAWLN